MPIKTMEDLYVNELKDLYSAEKQILKALPRMAKAASHPELRQAFQEHVAVTEEQVRRLETIFDELGKAPRGKKCKGMEGLLEEGKEIMSEVEDEELLDAGLIGAAQRVEHYEIAGYGCARTFARQLGRHDVADLLQQTLNEEANTDKLLTQVAEGLINPLAARA